MRAATPTVPTPSHVRYRLAWLALLTGAAVHLAWGLGRESLWLDETFTAAMARHPVRELLGLVAQDVHPPLYYVLMRCAALVAGQSETALRMPSMLAVLGLIALGAGPVTRLAGRRAGLLFGALVAACPGALCFAQEARMYGLAMLLVTANLTTGLLAVRDGRRWDMVLYGFTAAAAAMTHYYAMMAVAWSGVGLLIVAVRRGGPVRGLLLAQLAAALAFAPWAAALARQVGTVKRDFWIPRPGWPLIRTGLLAPFGYKFEDLAQPWVSLLTLLGLMGFTIAGAIVAARRRDTQRVLHVALPLLLHVAVLGTGLTLCWLVRPVFMPRYLIVLLGTLMLASALALDALPGRIVPAAVVAGVTLCSMPTLYQVHSGVFHGASREVAAHVMSQRASTAAADQEVFLYTDSMVAYPMREHLKHGRHLVLYPREWWVSPADALVYRDPGVRLVHDLDAALAGASALWLIDTSTTPFPGIRQAILARSGWKETVPVRRWEPEQSFFARMSACRLERRGD